MVYEGILKRDNSGLYLKSHGQTYRLILQRMPVDLIEKQVTVTGELDNQSEDNNIILAEGIRIDDSYPINR